VLPVDEPGAARVARLKIGSPITVSGSGTIQRKGRSR
jgi:hypothetical protein